MLSPLLLPLLESSKVHFVCVAQGVGGLEYLWPDNKRAGMPFSKLVNAAHQSPAISAKLFPLEMSVCLFYFCVLDRLEVLIMEMFSGSRALQLGRNKHAA